ncbi:MAG: hypothetical protein M3Y23_04585 [Actinomycetota bacterium]|nr:hypothetical protein [Actinomycetota bacterium]
MKRKPFETNYAGAIYGTILSMAVISTASKDPDAGPIMIACWAAATAIVFWLAHVYSKIVAAGFARPSEATGLARRALREEWPLVQGSLIPAGAMLLAPLGLVDADNATYVAVWVGVAVLFVAGIVVGTREELSWSRRLTIGLINAAIGSLIVALKIFVH